MKKLIWLSILICSGAYGQTLNGGLNGSTFNGVQIVGFGTNTSIHAAVAALGANGGMVFVPCGTYSDNVDISTSFVRIIGASQYCVTITPANVAQPVFTIDALAVRALENVVIENLAITCPLNTTCSDGIQIKGNGTNQPNDEHEIRHVVINSATPGTSATFGFANGISILGRTIWSKFENITELNSRGNGLNINTSQPVNGDIWKDSQFSSNWNYGVFINVTSSPASTNNTIDNTTIQLNGINAALTNCAGFYSNGIGEMSLTNDYWENNCANNSSPSTIAHVRLTGTYNQAFNVLNGTFFSPNNEWSIYNDTTQSTGRYDGNSEASGRGIFVTTSNASSAIYIGANFGFPAATITRDASGNTHVYSPVFSGTFTTTSATSESVKLAGCTANSHAWVQATNSTAAALTGIFVSSPTSGGFTLNHSPTSGGTFNTFCTIN